MTTLPANPNIEAIRESIRSSNASLHQLIDGPLAGIDAKQLYQSPAENEWTIMQNLAHIVEFMPYWASEIEKLVAEPGSNFGRTPEDVGRLQGISDHEMASLSKIKQALPGSYQRLDDVLKNLKDSDLELTGIHVRYGEKHLDWLIEEFVTNHLRGHVEQIKSSIASVG